MRQVCRRCGHWSLGVTSWTRLSQGELAKTSPISRRVAGPRHFTLPPTPTSICPSRQLSFRRPFRLWAKEVHIAELGYTNTERIPNSSCVTSKVVRPAVFSRYTYLRKFRRLCVLPSDSTLDQFLSGHVKVPRRRSHGLVRGENVERWDFTILTHSTLKVTQPQQGQRGSLYRE